MSNEACHLIKCLRSDGTGVRKDEFKIEGKDMFACLDSA